MNRLADLILRYPRWVLAFVVAASLGAVLYLAFFGLRYDYNLENFLPADDPAIQAYEAFTAQYEPDDNVIAVGFEASDVFAFDVLRDVRAITDSLERLPDVDEVVSLVSAEALVDGESGLTLEPLIGEIVNDAETRAAQRARVMADSLAVGYVVNRAADATAVFVEISPEANDFEGRRAVIEGVQRVLAPYADRYDVRYSGIPYIRNTYVEQLQVEVVKYVSLSSLVILLVLLWLFRSAVGVVLPLAIVYLGVLWTSAAMMIAGSPIDILTSTTATIILVVGIADAVHLLTKYYNGIQGGLAKRAAVREMIVRLGAATLLTSVTTAIGFGTLATSEIVPLQRFGLFTAVGVMLVYVLSIATLPVMLLWTKPPSARQVDRLSGGRLDRWLGSLDRLTRTRPKAILLGAALVVAACGLGATQLRVNSYVNDDLGPGNALYDDMVFFQNRLVSPFPLELRITADTPEAFKDPDNLRRIAAVQAYLESRPEVKRTVSLADPLRRLNEILPADSVAGYRLPERRDEVAQYLLLLEMTDGERLARLVDFDYREVRIAALMDDVGSAHLKDFRVDLDAFLADTLGPDLAVMQTGLLVLASGVADHLTESLLVSIGLAVLFISALMGALFRNVKLVLLSLVPNLLPLVVTAGLMGAFGIDIKPATAVVFSISFGIAVDDTIHFLARFRQEIALGRPFEDAIRTTILGTGRAIVLTSVILIGGFSVLLTSQFESSAYMGVLVSATIAAALLADLLLLPALLHLWKPSLSAAELQVER